MAAGLNALPAVPPAPLEAAAGLDALPAVPPAPLGVAAGLDAGLGVLGKHRLQRLNELAEDWLCLGREFDRSPSPNRRQLTTVMTWTVWVLFLISGSLS